MNLNQQPLLSSTNVPAKLSIPKNNISDLNFGNIGLGLIFTRYPYKNSPAYLQVSAIEPCQAANNAYNHYRHDQMATRMYMLLKI